MISSQIRKIEKNVIIALMKLNFPSGKLNLIREKVCQYRIMIYFSWAFGKL